MVSYIVGLLGVIISFIGWFGYHSITALLFGTSLYILETLLERNNLNDNAKVMDVIIFLIGCIVGIFIKKPFYICGMLAINFWSAAMTALGLPMIIIYITKSRK